MQNKFDFDSIELEKKASEYKKIKIDPSQGEIIDQLTEGLLEFIDIYPTALKGFVMISISIWQKSSKRTLAEVFNDEPQDRIRVVTEISVILRKLLTGALNSSNQTDDLEKAISTCLETYEEKWAYR